MIAARLTHLRNVEPGGFPALSQREAGDVVGVNERSVRACRIQGGSSTHRRRSPLLSKVKPLLRASRGKVSGFTLATPDGLVSLLIRRCLAASSRYVHASIFGDLSKRMIQGDGKWRVNLAGGFRTSRAEAGPGPR
jgi:hypothetical protein